MSRDVCQVTTDDAAYAGVMAKSYVLTSEQVGDSFELPPPIRGLAERLRSRLKSTTVDAAEDAAGTRMRDELFLLDSLGFASELELVAKDLRTLLNAYSHAVATERPSLQEVASWQRVTPGNLRRRYTAAHVNATRALLAERISFDLVQGGFASVRDEMLDGLNDRASTDRRLRSDVREAYFELIDRTANVLHGEGWRERTLVESRFDPNPLRGYIQVSASSYNEVTPLSSISASAIDRALSELGPEHAEYVAFERTAVAQADV